MKKMLMKLVFIVWGVLFFFPFSTDNFLVEGASLPPVTSGNILPGPESGKDAKYYVTNQLIPGISNGTFIFLLMVSSIMLIIAGFFYLTSSGDTEMTKQAKDIILWTIVGVAIAALSYTFVKFIINIDFF
ncbi:hypothetical protein KAI58_01170 [Candidatus Gracilibacteria bacterium]|nr:hypothetical protein [Candidatus Gracilibacteria bacterium]